MIAFAVGIAVCVEQSLRADADTGILSDEPREQHRIGDNNIAVEIDIAAAR